MTTQDDTMNNLDGVPGMPKTPIALSPDEAMLASQELIQNITRASAMSKDLEDLLSYTVSTVGAALGFSHCYIVRCDEESVDDIPCFSCTPVAEWYADGEGSISSVYKGLVCDQCDDILRSIAERPYTSLHDCCESSGVIAEALCAKSIRSIAFVPISADGRLWGFAGADYGPTPTEWDNAIFSMALNLSVVLSAQIEKDMLMRQLEDASKQAREASRAKSEFLSRMSHEIRTPMNAIIGMNEIAKKSDDPDRIRYCLDKIGVAAAQLLSLINDILDISKIEANKMEIVNEEFNIETVLDGLYHVIQSRVEDKNIEFTFDLVGIPERYIISDKLRITQVATNFLSNAVKFTPEYGSIVFHATVFPSESEDGTHVDMLRLAVRDTGIGISEEDQKKLFNSFEQANASISHKFGGTGLGLSICQKISALMGGSVGVESSLGYGSTFWFEIPIGIGKPLPPTVARPRRAKDVRVLVIDKDEDTCVACRHMIEHFEMNCDVADSVGNAIPLLARALQAERPYDAVFYGCTASSPDLDASIKTLLGSCDASKITLLIHTHDLLDMRTQTAEYGFTHFLMKPVLPSMLFDAILGKTGTTVKEHSDDVTEEDIDWTGRRILIAEDIELNQEIIKTILEPTGVEIDCVFNGREALDAFASNGSAYDAILMDMEMPEMDGLSATTAIRKMGTDIPIIAMTANAFTEDIERCKAAGMNDHLAKPIDVKIVLKKLDKFLRMGAKVNCLG